MWRCGFEVEKLNVDDEFSGEGNLNRPDEVIVGLELLISNLCKYKINHEQVRIAGEFVFRWTCLDEANTCDLQQRKSL